MYLFKYYRPDFFFDKAIRYNELYFSASAQLNDPNDLNLDYRFDNRLNLWSYLLHSKCEYSYEDLSHILDLSQLKIVQGLNKIFKGKRIKGNLESLDNLFDEHLDDIRKVIREGMLPINRINPIIYDNSPEPEQKLVTICENGIKERLYRKIIPAVFSVSFSSNALDRMMWAHYAGGFSGCVVIYETQQRVDNTLSFMKLRDNVFSSNTFTFPIKPIKYSNQAKEVSLLEPGVDITELFCIKNRFWKYESEYRMFVPEANVGIGNERDVKDIINRNVGHIFHHDVSAIQGVIFGPRMSTLKKEEIWQTIKSNMENATNPKPCYFFDSELSPTGKIAISMGQQAIPMQGYALIKTTMNSTQLSEILNDIGIAK